MRLVPFIITFSVLALGVRVLTLSTEITPSLLPSLSAQEAPQDKPETPADKTADKSDEADDHGDADDHSADQSSEAGLPAVNGLDFGSLASCSDEDIRLVNQLRQRRLQLDQRQQELEIRENLLLATEYRIEESTKRLEELELQIKAHLKLFDEREQTQLQRVVKVYESMKAKDAAPRFERLGIDIQVDLATIMPAKKVAAIIAAMTPQGAVELTSRLATIASAPSLDDVQGNSR